MVKKRFTFESKALATKECHRTLASLLIFTIIMVIMITTASAGLPGFIDIFFCSKVYQFSSSC